MIIVFTGRFTNLDGEHVGVKQVGKDTCADIVKEILGSNYRFEYISFAAHLKESVCRTYGLDRNYYDDPKHKEETIEHLGVSYRYLLEQIGTNVVRMGLEDPDMWVRQYVRDVERAGMSTSERIIAEMYRDEEIPNVDVSVPKDPREVIVLTTDCRFPNEYEALQRMKDVVVIQVHRVGDLPAAVDPHPSNCYYPEMVPDYVVQNDGSMEDLRLKIEKIVDTFKK